ncbi:hypothetical protein ACNJYC_11220 [Bradyrhizobium sp. DASA03007]|uniref:hypothetical protein n=1 Tax=Bradyrhizobium sp. SPXBL-03 TaxID=3395913 RepID=UPI003F6EEDB9
MAWSSLAMASGGVFLAIICTDKRPALFEGLTEQKNGVWRAKNAADRRSGNARLGEGMISRTVMVLIRLPNCFRYPMTGGALMDDMLA